MKKIVVFSGAGLDKESGISTFRDSADGLWNNFKIDDVATLDGWRKDRSKVLEFYNQRRRELPNVQPNDAHYALVTLESEYDVTHVTQNVTDLLERAGSSKVLHLHGELTKARSSYLNGNPIMDKLGVNNNPIHIGYNDINLGDKCEKYGAQLRPHIVWFGEYPFFFYNALEAFIEADIIIIIGTSMNIGYTYEFFKNCKKDTPIYFVDPEPTKLIELEYPDLKITYIEKGAVEGVNELINKLMVQAIGDDKNDK
jgi:NAD-dependent deacetylase